MIDPSIFRSYDIRGVYPEAINECLAEKVGFAVVKHLKAKEVVVGRDMRLSSPVLFASLVRGINQAGADVVDIGMVPTPVTYFAVVHLKAKAGIMISASHNPPEYNGFKIVGEKAIQLSKESGIEDIKKIVLESVQKNRGKRGKVKKFDISGAYYNHILRFVKPTTRRLKVVIDAGNGMGGDFFKPVFEKLNVGKLETSAAGKIKSYSLLANRKYFITPPKIDRIIFNFYDNYQEAKKGLLANEVDGISPLDIADINFFKQKKNYQIKSIVLPRYYAVFWNLKKPIL